MKNKIRDKAQLLIQKFKTNDLEELAAHLKIMVFYVPLGSAAGSYQPLKNRRVIFINSDLDYQHRKVVLAHELGHAVLHPKMNCYFIKDKTLLLTSKIEREANIFASELLIRDDVLNQYIDKTLDEIAMSEYLPVELFSLKFL